MTHPQPAKARCELQPPQRERCITVATFAGGILFFDTKEEGMGLKDPLVSPYIHFNAEGDELRYSYWETDVPEGVEAVFENILKCDRWHTEGIVPKIIVSCGEAAVRAFALACGGEAIRRQRKNRELRRAFCKNP